jgi:hypothetical protein
VGVNIYKQLCKPTISFAIQSFGKGNKVSKFVVKFRSRSPIGAEIFFFSSKVVQNSYFNKTFLDFIHFIDAKIIFENNLKRVFAVKSRKMVATLLLLEYYLFLRNLF